MNDYAREQLAELRERFPGWCLWTVRYAVSRQVVWLAKPLGAPVATIAAESPEELAEAITEQEAWPQAR